MRPIQTKMPNLLTEKTNSLEQAFVEVILGRASAKCKHLGVCKIEGVHTNSFSQYTPAFCKSSNRIFALASLKKNAYFELTFERVLINDAVFEKHFKSGFFKMEEGYDIDSDLMGVNVYLSKGEYKVNFSDTLLSVRFDL